jgi:hypothetical protein
MKLTEVNSSKIPKFRGEARSVEELLASIKDGRFTLDGRKLVVHDDLSLGRLGLTSLIGCPQRVQGGFSCANNKLETLEGAPQEVGSHFMCYSNQLKTLKGAPPRVGGGFVCNDNQLKTLEGGPVEVGSHYICSNNKLTSLKGMPRIINGDFWCYGNQLTSFEGCAQTIQGGLYCQKNRLLVSLEGGPSFVDGDVDLSNCSKLTSLQNIHLHFPEVHGSFILVNTNVRKHMLGLILVRGLKDINIDDTKLWSILHKYLNKGNNHLLTCALELADAGYDEQAKL